MQLKVISCDEGWVECDGFGDRASQLEELLDQQDLVGVVTFFGRLISEVGGDDVFVQLEKILPFFVLCDRSEEIQKNVDERFDIQQKMSEAVGCMIYGREASDELKAFFSDRFKKGKAESAYRTALRMMQAWDENVVSRSVGVLLELGYFSEESMSYLRRLFEDDRFREKRVEIRLNILSIWERFLRVPSEEYECVLDLVKKGESGTLDRAIRLICKWGDEAVEPEDAGAFFKLLLTDSKRKDVFDAFIRVISVSERLDDKWIVDNIVTTGLRHIFDSNRISILSKMFERSFDNYECFLSTSSLTRTAVRYIAVNALGLAGSTCSWARGYASEVLNDDNSEVRRSAVWALSRIGQCSDKDLEKILTFMKEKESDWLFRAESARALFYLAPKRQDAAEVVMSLIEDTHDQVRKYAISSLKNVGEGSIAQKAAARRLMTDSCQSVCVAAVETFVWFSSGSDEDVHALLLLRAEASEDVRKALDGGLGRIAARYKTVFSYLIERFESHEDARLETLDILDRGDFQLACLSDTEQDRLAVFLRTVIADFCQNRVLSEKAVRVLGCLGKVSEENGRVLVSYISGILSERKAALDFAKSYGFFPALSSEQVCLGVSALGRCGKGDSVEVTFLKSLLEDGDVHVAEKVLEALIRWEACDSAFVEYLGSQVQNSKLDKGYRGVLLRHWMTLCSGTQQVGSIIRHILDTEIQHFFAVEAELRRVNTPQLEDVVRSQYEVGWPFLLEGVTAFGRCEKKEELIQDVVRGLTEMVPYAFDIWASQIFDALANLGSCEQNTLDAIVEKMMSCESCRESGSRALIALGQGNMALSRVMLKWAKGNDLALRQIGQHVFLDITIPSSDVVADILPMLDDDDKGIRKNGLVLLEKMGRGDENEIRFLARRAEDKSQKIKEQALDLIIKKGWRTRTDVNALRYFIPDIYGKYRLNWDLRFQLRKHLKAQFFGDEDIAARIVCLEDLEHVYLEAFDELKKLGLTDSRVTFLLREALPHAKFKNRLLRLFVSIADATYDNVDTLFTYVAHIWYWGDSRLILTSFFERVYQGASQETLDLIRDKTMENLGSGIERKKVGAKKVLTAIGVRDLNLLRHVSETFSLTLVYRKLEKHSSLLVRSAFMHISSEKKPDIVQNGFSLISKLDVSEDNRVSVLSELLSGDEVSVNFAFAILNAMSSNFLGVSKPAVFKGFYENEAFILAVLSVIRRDVSDKEGVREDMGWRFHYGLRILGDISGKNREAVKVLLEVLSPKTYLDPTCFQRMIQLSYVEPLLFGRVLAKLVEGIEQRVDEVHGLEDQEVVCGELKKNVISLFEGGMKPAMAGSAVQSSVELVGSVRFCRSMFYLGVFPDPALRAVVRISGREFPLLARDREGKEEEKEKKEEACCVVS